MQRVLHDKEELILSHPLGKYWSLGITNQIKWHTWCALWAPVQRVVACNPQHCHLVKNKCDAPSNFIHFPSHFQVPNDSSMTFPIQIPMVFRMKNQCHDSLHYVFLGTDPVPPVPEDPGAYPAVRNTPWHVGRSMEMAWVTRGDHWDSSTFSMDWFSRENRHRKPMGFYHQMNWVFLRIQWHSEILQISPCFQEKSTYQPMFHGVLLPQLDHVFRTIGGEPTS